MPTTINPSDQTITQYNIQTGGASNALNNVAPSSTSGVAIISQGASSQPVFGTVVVAGGGTGAVSLTGVLTGNGTSAVTASTVTQNGVIVGGASNALTSTAVGSTGQVLQANTSAAPTYSTATYPSTATGTGKILRADGTNWTATTATFPDTAGTSGNILTSNGTNWTSAAPATSGTVTSVSGTTNRITSTGGTTPVIDISASYVGQASINTIGTITTGTWNGTTIAVANGGTSNTSQPAFSLVAGGTTTTGAFQSVASVATGQVLISNGTASLPVYSATPTLTSVTFGAGNALNSYQTGTWTPTFAFSTSSAGVTYTNQLGQYVKIGQLVFISGRITLSSKGTASGVITITGLPFTSSISTTTQQIYIDMRNALTLNATYTDAILEIPTASTISNTAQIGSGLAKLSLSDTNLANNTDITFSGCFTSV